MAYLSIFHSPQKEEYLASLINSLPEWLKSDFFARFPTWNVLDIDFITLQFAAINMTVYIAIFTLFLCIINLSYICILTLFEYMRYYYSLSRPPNVFRFIPLRFMKNMEGIITIFGITGLLLNSISMKYYCTKQLVSLGPIADEIFIKNINSFIADYPSAIYVPVTVAFLKLYVVLIAFIILFTNFYNYFLKMNHAIYACVAVFVILYIWDIPVSHPVSYTTLFESYGYISTKIFVCGTVSLISILTLIVLRFRSKKNKTIEMFLVTTFIVSLLFTISGLIYFYCNYIPIELGEILDKYADELIGNRDKYFENIANAYLKNI